MGKVLAIIALVYLGLGSDVHAQEERDPRLDIPGPEFSTRDLTVCQKEVSDLLVEQSRNEYYAEGRPCACPYDIVIFPDYSRACKEWSAYIKDNGEEPLCSRDDVDIEQLKKFCSAIGS